MSTSSPSLSEWKRLYDLAIEFKRLGCWNWIYDDEFFGVQNPTSGEIGYCCIMGMNGEHFALAVYLGSEGLQKILSFISRDEDKSPLDFLSIQDCLMVSFENREFLDKKDHEVIKRLGLKFRGRSQWPLFRRYTPGYFPWFLTREEAKFLSVALEQAIDVARRYAKNRQLLDPPQNGRFLVRVPRRQGKQWVWQDRWLSPKPVRREKLPPVVYDEFRLHRLLKTVRRRNSVWEIDFFFAPVPIAERNERPYYPKICLWVEQMSGMILATELAQKDQSRQQFADKMLQLCEIHKWLPEKIVVKREEAYTLFEPFAQKLKIQLELNEDYSVLDEAREDMTEHFFRYQ